MCENLDKRKTTGLHVFEHVESEVALNCFEAEDGKVYDRDRMRWRKHPVEGLYVHPRTRLLSWKEPCFRQEQRRAEKAKKQIERVEGVAPQRGRRRPPAHGSAGVRATERAAGVEWARASGVRRAERGGRPGGAADARPTAPIEPINGNKHYINLKGIWYVGELEKYSLMQKFNGEPCFNELFTEGDKVWWIMRKRQCNSKELKAAGLKNDPVAE